MQNFHEEEVLGKAYDARLMRRLLRYAKPYWSWILLSILLLFAITGLELLRPYLVKVAIDEHINAYYRPYLVFEEKPETDLDGFIYQGMYYIRSDEIDESLYPNVQRKQIIYKKGTYYLISGVINVNEDFSIQPIDNEQVIIKVGEKEFTGKVLKKADLKLFRKKDADAVFRISLIFIALLILGFCLNYGQVYLLQWTGQKIIFNIREELFSHIEKLSLSFFDNNPVGRLVTRVTNDVQTLNEMYTSVLVNLFKDLFMLVGILIVMLKLNFRLALYSFTVLPLIIISTIIFRIKAREAYRKVRTRLAQVNANLAENISGMKIVQIFNQEKKKFNEFDRINKSYYKATLEELLAFAIFRPMMEIISSLGLAIILWFGGKQVIQGSLQFGVLFAFVNYIQQFFRPILDLTEKYNILQSAMASSERIFMLLDEKEGIPNPKKPQKLEQVRGSIEFKDVWFAYNEDEWVLKGINFTINPGETVAFVGATGAGKSSIINLISRFYDIQKGQILIDGKDIKTLDKYELRKRIGIVLQDVFLFTGDIKSNIRLNDKTITDEKIQEVARYVNADQFISKLPKKYDEPVTERGSTLSAGQRQLLAFARTLAYDPDILILDEATANIDTETELLIQDALKKLTKDRTTLIIAHRLSTIQHADKIIVLHKGKIREMGTHQELLAKKGIYYKLYQLQYKENFTSKQNNAAC
ncbi:lipid A ABC transporter permease/ATP-binding protein [Anoxybacter fermentans]|uniref:Lipid A ABC transporter permease/ATP-binding protein n=1 Tax=Anoxybacter fermentans TaxID=1323375 RepID=A0A3Q9HNX7_9FIRM|nr:ABC transporter ATP-binding protein [Anoxybacter fermentans]AZR72137.1 lipid A ABC transporter permease/ATP-binding protein [Anoxybacter fermentans]